MKLLKTLPLLLVLSLSSGCKESEKDPANIALAIAREVNKLDKAKKWSCSHAPRDEAKQNDRALCTRTGDNGLEVMICEAGSAPFECRPGFPAKAEKAPAPAPTTEKSP